MTEGAVLELLLACASAVFGRPVGADDNFFDLGGDSLSAIELGARVEDGLRHGIDLDAVFTADSFAELAGEWAGDGAVPGDAAVGRW